jgi:UDP-N-acetylmuramoyl-L-alanyl-D-glutamate--2,6-diaminopimelate ligase
MNAMLPMNALPLYLSLQPLMKAGAQMTGDTRVLKAGDVMLAYPMGNQRIKSDNRAYMLQALSLGAALVLYEPQGLEDILNKNDLQLVKDEQR